LLTFKFPCTVALISLSRVCTSQANQLNLPQQHLTNILLICFAKKPNCIETIIATQFMQRLAALPKDTPYHRQNSLFLFGKFNVVTFGSQAYILQDRAGNRGLDKVYS